MRVLLCTSRSNWKPFLFSDNQFDVLSLSPIDKCDDLDVSFNDSWTEKSNVRSEKSDPDFNLTEYENCYEEVNVKLNEVYDFAKDRVVLVYMSQLDKLLSRCLECGKPVDEKTEMKGDGTQFRLRMTCLEGCDTKWSSQPELKSVAGTFLLQ